MADRECVLCGAPGVKDRRSCLDCGGTVVEVRELAFAAVAASPASEHTGGAPLWAAVDAGPDPARQAVHRSASPLQAEVRARARRALVLAWVVCAAAVLMPATLFFLRSQAPHDTSSAPTQIEAYTNGEGKLYRTASFSVRLPGRPRVERQYLAVGLRADDGRSLPVTVATTNVSGVRVDVGHGALDAALTSEVHTAIADGGSGLALGVGDDSEFFADEITFQGARGFDETVDTDTGSARVRILFHGSRIVYLVVAGQDNVDTVFETAVESLRLR
jgi:hypothetical protein